MVRRETAFRFRRRAFRAALRHRGVPVSRWEHHGGRRRLQSLPVGQLRLIREPVRIRAANHLAVDSISACGAHLEPDLGMAAAEFFHDRVDAADVRELAGSVSLPHGSGICVEVALDPLEPVPLDGRTQELEYRECAGADAHDDTTQHRSVVDHRLIPAPRALTSGVNARRREARSPHDRVGSLKLGHAQRSGRGRTGRYERTARMWSHQGIRR